MQDIFIDHSDHYLLKATFYVQNTQQEENDDKCPKDDSVLDLKILDIDEYQTCKYSMIIDKLL